MFVFSWVGTAIASCAATCACQACVLSAQQLRRTARLTYCVLFTLAMLLAWVLRDFAKPLMDKLPCEAPDVGRSSLETLCTGANGGGAVQGSCFPASPVSAGMGNKLYTASAWATLCASSSSTLCWLKLTSLCISAKTERSCRAHLQLFFGLLSLTMIGVKFKGDKRDQYLQHGGWFVKIGLWLLFNALPFFLPVSLVSSYGAAVSLYDTAD